MTYRDLHTEVKLDVPPSALYIQHTVLVDTNRIDWIVLMAFMDNHSGNFHGSGHFGCMIVDGKDKGLYADFGTYHMILKNDTAVQEGGDNVVQVKYKDFVEETFDMVRVGDEVEGVIIKDGRLPDSLGLNGIKHISTPIATFIQYTDLNRVCDRLRYPLHHA